MTTKRKADLQRKLALAPVPKPPAGLADRIKSEIPGRLLIDKERARLRQAVAFNVRVAASIILLVSSVYLALHLLSRSFQAPELETASGPAPAVARGKMAARTDLAAAREAPASSPIPLAKIEAPAAVAPVVEVSVSPFDTAKNIVRVTAPKAEVKFNDAVVASSKRISPEVYEVVLRRVVSEDEPIVTVRATGVEHVIRRGDVRSWNEASRGMKSASLAVALKRGASRKDVAAKARAAGLDDVAAAAEGRPRP